MSDNTINCDLVINITEKEAEIALLEDKRLVEFNKESREASFAVGNIYLGRVKKVMKGLNAAFIDVGYERDAFLHYQDLGPQFKSLNRFLTWNNGDKRKVLSSPKFKREGDIEKDGIISNELETGKHVLVQVVKEPISTKGPRLTSELSIAGRYLVLIPFSDKVSISQKIKSQEERLRLKNLMLSIKPRNFGVIVRTVAEGRKVADLDREIKTLVKRWDEMVIKAVHPKKKVPTLVLEEMGRAEVILRDLLDSSFNNIYVNNLDIFNELRDYVTIIAPEKAKIVSFYEKEQPIFDHFGVTKQIKSLFGKTISYQNGAYLIIEHTEALHVIDVNSGTRSKQSKSQKDNVLDVNIGAAKEIARQLRLRDMGGIIVVDFIDMADAEYRDKLYDAMKEAMSTDRTRHTILRLSKFGLMQIIRQRVRPEILIDPEEACPTCMGTGQARPSILFCDELESKIELLTQKLNINKLTLHVHPYVHAYIHKGIFSLFHKWKFRYGRGLKVKPIESFPFLDYEFLDEKGELIDIERTQIKRRNQ